MKQYIICLTLGFFLQLGPQSYSQSDATSVVNCNLSEDTTSQETAPIRPSIKSDPIPYPTDPNYPINHPQNPNNTNSDNGDGAGSGSTQEEGPERLITFVHGLQGSDDSWATAATALESKYKFVQERPEYDQPSWQIAEDELFEDCKEGTFYDVTSNNLNPTKSFAIGHSLGGLMSRRMQQKMAEENVPDNENSFHGVITIGSPLAGSELGNKVHEIEDWLYDGIKALVNAYGNEILENSTNNLVEALIQSIADVSFDHPFETLEALLLQQSEISLYDDIYSDGFETIIAMFDPGILYEIRPQSAQIQNLQNFSNDLPSVCMYGIEDDPVLIRYLSSRIYSANAPAFADNNDQELVDQYQDLWEKLQMKEEFYFNQYLNYPDCNWFPNPFSCTSQSIMELFAHWDKNDLFVASQNFREARRWVGNINNSWKSFIGSIELQTTLEGYYCQCEEFENGAYNGMSQYIVNGQQECALYDSLPNQDCQFYQTPIYSYQMVEVSPSDGVVPVYSQTAYPNAGDFVDMIGSNHQQERNDTNLKKAMDDLFSGAKGIYFKTNPI